jgi:Predicted membrane protein (DUF2207)
MNKHPIRRIILLVLSFLVALSLGVARGVAQELPFYWDSINVNLEVQTNGDLLVTEQQTYVFKSDYSNQRYRYIRLNKVDEIRDVTVQENDRIIESETGIENNQFWIRWQHELKPPEKHTFVLKYRVVGGLQMDDQNARVYWKAIFADRKVPVQKAKVQVQLPETLSGKATSFTTFGAPAIARAVNPRTFEFVANEPIQPQQVLEVQVAFPAQILNLPQPQWQQRQSRGNLWTLNPFWVFAILIILAIAALKIRSLG